MFVSDRATPRDEPSRTYKRVAGSKALSDPQSMLTDRRWEQEGGVLRCPRERHGPPWVAYVNRTPEIRLGLGTWHKILIF